MRPQLRLSERLLQPRSQAGAGDRQADQHVAERRDLEQLAVGHRAAVERRANAAAIHDADVAAAGRAIRVGHEVA